MDHSRTVSILCGPSPDKAVIIGIVPEAPRPDANEVHRHVVGYPDLLRPGELSSLHMTVATTDDSQVLRRELHDHHLRMRRSESKVQSGHMRKTE